MKDATSEIQSASSVNGLLRLLERGKLPLLKPPGQPAVDATLGLGFLSMTGGVCAPAVRSPPAPLERSAASSIWQIRKVETLETLRTTLSVGAAASFSGSDFEGNASAKLYSEASMELYTLVVLIRVLVTTKLLTFAPDERLLVPELVALAQAGKSGPLAHKYGDKYFDSVLLGGEYLAYINYSTSNQSEYERIDAALKASYGDFSGSGDFSSSMEHMKKISSTAGSQIINGAIRPIPSWQEVEAFALAFPTYVAEDGHESPTLYTTQFLDKAIDWPAEFRLDLRKESRRYAEIAGISEHAKLLKKSWEYVQSNPGQFLNANSESARATAQSLERTLEAISEEKENIEFDIGQYTAPSPMPVYDVSPYENMPQRLSTFRPQIKTTWEEGNPKERHSQVTNNFDPANYSLDWIRSSGGNATSGLWGTMIAFVEPVPGIELWMNVRFGTPSPKDSGWLLANTWTPGPDDGWFITGLALDIRGPMADQYLVDYSVWCNDLGPSNHCGNAPGVQQGMREFAEYGLYAVQGLRIVIYPIA